MNHPLLKEIRHNPLLWLLVFVPAVLVGSQKLEPEAHTMLFVVSVLAQQIVPLAALLSHATESVAAKTGDAVGGLLNATLGNLTELMIALTALRAGQYMLVKASIAGAIVTNSLFMLGALLPPRRAEVSHAGVQPDQRAASGGPPVPGNHCAAGSVGLEPGRLGASGRVYAAIERGVVGPADRMLIGGATTSRAHTAVKVDPRYDGPVVWVKDASRSVQVVAALLSDARREAYLDDVRADFDALRTRHAAKHDRPLVPLTEARRNAPAIDWSGYEPPVPQGLEAASAPVRHELRFTVAELRDYIDWTPFFNAWEMKGAYPDILDDAAMGETARKLFDEAQQMLDRVDEQGWLDIRAVCGFWPAASVGDDIELYADGSRADVVTVLHHLRQQGQHREGVPNRCLADFVAPKEHGTDDFVGAFAVTAGLGAQERVAEYKAAHDDYSAILLESVADRLAEACAEKLHEQVRTTLWGYAPDEKLDSRALIKEEYDGIRPAPGYPACPEHTEKATLWELLDVPETAGIELTESMAMWPGASVSGWYFSHPESQYFVVGRLGPDQVADYARRKGWDVREAERWLSSNLGYEPEE